MRRFFFVTKLTLNLATIDSSTSLADLESSSSPSSDGETDFTLSNSASTASAGESPLGLVLFVTKLSNGDEVTLTASDEPYTTTTNGQTFTVEPASTNAKATGTADEDSINSTPRNSKSPGQTGTATSVLIVNGVRTTIGGGYTSDGGVGSAPSSSPTVASSGNSNNNDDMPPAGTIAGGVVGGCAGLAAILLVVMVVLRWYKRRAQNGHQMLAPGSDFSPEPEPQASMSQGPGMAERAGLVPLMSSVPAIFRHRTTPSAPPGPPSERGFTRISGRKLPSAFSEGMSSGGMSSGGMSGEAQQPAPAPVTPIDERNSGNSKNLSDTSWYRDSRIYSDNGHEVDLRGSSPEEMTLSPGPQRVAMVHRGGMHTPSPRSTVVRSPRAPASTPYSRSMTPTGSLPDNRSSRFTEEV